jgi:ribosome biogenesis GTPase
LGRFAVRSTYDANVVAGGLARWGANDRVVAELDRLAEAALAGTLPGRVSRVDRTESRVVTGDAELRCDDGGHGPLAVGDYVLVDDRGARAAVRLRLERSSCLTRSTGTGSVPQVLAANLDEVFITVPADQPFDAGRLERLLTVAGDSGAATRVVITKHDLDDGAVVESAARAVAAGVVCTALSVRTGSGLAELAAAIGPGRTVALVGTSGAGKSSLINALLGDDRLLVGAVRSADGKGRHTTSWRELVALPGAGVVIDTPGIRSLGLWLDAGGLDDTFADVLDLAANCRFSDCTHDREPGCAVRDAVTAGTLDPRRLASYDKLLAEAEMVAARNDERLARARGRRWQALEREGRARARRR